MVANIEKHELAVTGSAVALAVTSAASFPQSGDCLEEEMLCNDSSVASAMILRANNSAEYLWVALWWLNT